MSEQKKRKSAYDYEPAPQPSPEVQPLYESCLKVLTGELTVTAAAQQLHLSRNRFQTLMHRGLQGMLEALGPRPNGRPAKPRREVELEAELQQVRKQNAYLQQRVDSVDRLLGVASDLVRGKLSLKGRSRQTGAKQSPEATPNDAAEEPDGAARQRLEGVQTLRALGLTVALAGALMASSPRTLRRHAARAARSEPLVQSRGPQPKPPSPELIREGANVVREMKGLIGAEALSHKVPGLSRRRAAAIKEQTLTELERERLAACERVIVSRTDVVRGFDAMHVSTTAGWWYLLAAADASVPYRTLLLPVNSYESTSVAAALELDIQRNGAPLAYRLDRAKCHRTDEVHELLNQHGVLMLHGPPRHPQYYGQLERQNREHRAWLDVCGTLNPQQLNHEAARMKTAWNSTLPRRILSWQTATDVWNQRTQLVVDRQQLKDEVADRAARLQRQLDVRGGHADLAERLAIEATLMKRGWLERRGGRTC
jgi:hypothetical protein